jgi:hypothetical protein
MVLPMRASELSYQDSNLERQNQNLQCYHYTIGQDILKKRCAKVELILKSENQIGKVFLALELRLKNALFWNAQSFFSSLFTFR